MRSPRIPWYTVPIFFHSSIIVPYVSWGKMYPVNSWTSLLLFVFYNQSIH